MNYYENIYEKAFEITHEKVEEIGKKIKRTILKTEKGTIYYTELSSVKFMIDEGSNEFVDHFLKIMNYDDDDLLYDFQWAVLGQLDDFFLKDYVDKKASASNIIIKEEDVDISKMSEIVEEISNQLYFMYLKFYYSKFKLPEFKEEKIFRETQNKYKKKNSDVISKVGLIISLGLLKVLEKEFENNISKISEVIGLLIGGKPSTIERYLKAYKINSKEYDRNHPLYSKGYYIMKAKVEKIKSK